MRDKYILKNFIWSSHYTVALILNNSKTNSILDVGSSRGFLGQSLKYKPTELLGVDKTAFSLPPPYTSFFKEDLDTTDFSFLKSKKFQAIVLADVLEHLQNPVHVVTKLKEHLEDDGFFVASIPNMGFIVVRIVSFLGFRPKMKKGLYDMTHLHDFDFNTMNLFIKKVDFEILDIKYVPVPLHLFSNLFKDGSLLFFIYKIINFITQKIPKTFAYQFVFTLKIK